MFYDVFVQLCNSVNKTPSAVAVELDIAKSAVSNWKKRGTSPTGANLHKIAGYFGVSVDYLLNEETKKSPAEAEDDEINEYLEELKNNPGMRILFSKTKGATKEELEKVVKMIEIMRGDSF